MRILIAEDDRATLRMLTNLATSWGYEAVAVQDGLQALQALAGDPSLQLALLDWELPGMDGPEVCGRIRAVRGDGAIHLILLTSRGGLTDVIAGLEAGADDYLVKPFDGRELRARLQAATRILMLQQRLADHVARLELALTQVHALRGLLPICAYCKAIRDDSNYWHKVEEYMSDHADVQFSHGICPKCMPAATAELDAERGDR